MQLIQGIAIALSPGTILWLLLGTGIGLVIGVLPAIGAMTGVVLFLPLTYGLDLGTAIVFLMAIYATGQYGDSVSSILINAPGGPGTVASCWEGYPMARRGEGARALGIATFGSMIGGLAGSLAMIALAWPLTELALMIGPPEYFALGIMALSLISIAAKEEMIKGIIMGCFGLALSFVGEDPVSGLVPRFSFGYSFLAASIPTVALLVGVFAIGQVIRMLEEGTNITQEATPKLSVRSALVGFVDVLKHPKTVLRAMFFGVYIGILPALGVATATVTSYLVEKKYSKDGDKFGTGVPAGLIATEVSKGCCVVGDMIPTFMLGIPGSVTGAIIMAAFIMHGIQPGPEFLLAGTMPYVVFAGIILTQFIIVLVGLPLIKYFAYLTRIPNALLGPLVGTLCFLGALTERSMPFDMVYLIVFGVLGYWIDKLGYSAICLIIGFILGPLIETNLHRTIGMGFGSYQLLWTRPLTLIFFFITFLFVSWPYVKGVFRKRSILATKTLQTENSGATAPKTFEFGEIVLLSLISLASFIMLVDARRYSSAVALFPNFICSLLLFFITVRGGLFIAGHGVKQIGLSFRLPTLSAGSMSWEYSLVTLFGYYLLILVIGFPWATILYLVSIPFLLRYPKKAFAVILALVTTACVFGLAKLLRVVLP